MKRSLALSLIFGAALAAGAIPTATPAVAAGVDLAAPAPERGARGRRSVEVIPGVWVTVRGARNWQQARYARLPAAWSADQQQVAREQGFPVFRLRDLTAGVLTEIWSYPAADLEFVFSDAGRLIGRRIQ